VADPEVSNLNGSSNFDQQCIEAEIGAADDLEQAAYERAVIGWEEPVITAANWSAKSESSVTACC